MFDIWVCGHVMVYLEGELVLVVMACKSMVWSANGLYPVKLAGIPHRGRLTKEEKRHGILVFCKMVPNGSF